MHVAFPDLPSVSLLLNSDGTAKSWCGESGIYLPHATTEILIGLIWGRAGALVNFVKLPDDSNEQIANLKSIVKCNIFSFFSLS